MFYGIISYLAQLFWGPGILFIMFCRIFGGADSGFGSGFMWGLISFHGGELQNQQCHRIGRKNEEIQTVIRTPTIFPLTYAD